jgi:cobaltochelatase CobN
VLPTGRNFYSVDPKGLPSALSWEVGQGLADNLLQRHLDEEERYPETIGIVVWGTAAMRTQGDDIAEVLSLLGVRPTWNEESRRVTGLEVMPLEELGRPRIDVTVRISGFFRDAFPNLISLMDDAFTTVAALDEPPESNFLKKHADEERGQGADERRATTRIFGSPPGAYGAGLLPLIDARNWQTDEDLAEVYAVWGGYAYGKGLDGVEAREAMEANLRRTEVAVKNIDNREHDLFDSDDYFQYHGGMIAAVRALTGRNPKSYVGDSADPSRPRTRSLDEEAKRVFRSRVANPKWISAMQRHGYKGAFELSATVDYLFGYDATANVVEDWMYREVTQKARARRRGSATPEGDLPGERGRPGGELLIRRLGTWLRAGRYRFVLPVVLLIVLQTVVLTLSGGWMTVIVGGITVLALVVLVMIYVFGGDGASR